MAAIVKSATIFIAFCLILSTLALDGAFSAPLLSAVLTRVYRRVECLAPPATQWTPAKEGKNLSQSDSLKTFNNSYADVELSKDSRFRVKENSLVRIESLFMESKEDGGAVVKLVELDLLKGEIVARLDKLPARTRLNLRSPVAVAAVRGTGFSFAQEEGSKQARVAVRNGSVKVQTLGEPEKYVTVGSDRYTTVAPWTSATLEARGTGLPPVEMLRKRLLDPKVPLEDAKALLERLESRKPSLEGLVISATADVAAPADIDDPAEAERWARNSARCRAQKQILEKLETVRLSADETIGDIMNRDQKLCAALLEGAGLAKIVKSEYLKGERRAIVRLEYPLASARKILGRDMSSAWREIAPISADEYAAAFGALIRLSAERAATVDAYRRLAERIYGTVINSSTTLKNFIVQNDRIVVTVKGVVEGAQEVSKRYYSDGSVDVVLRIPGGAVKSALTPVVGDILGSHYMASPEALSPEGFIALLSLEQM